MKTPAKTPARKGAKKLAGSKKAAPKKTAPVPAPDSKKVAPKKAVAQKAALKKATPKKALAKKLSRPAPVQAPMPAASPPTAEAAVMDRLFAVITARRSADPALSHSARLLSRGMDKVAQKFGEEAVECLIEAVGGNTEALVAESADVLYHLLVMWVAAGVQPDQVWAELARREGVSGIDEKAARPTLVGTTKIP